MASTRPWTARGRPRRRSSPASARCAARWTLGIDRQRDGVADDRLPRERVELRAEHRVQVAVRARQVVVQRALEPCARPCLRRVADDVRRERLPAGSGGSRTSGRPPSARGSRRAPCRRRRRSSPRLILNWATRLMALSCRAARSPAAHACQYVVPTTSAPISTSATKATLRISAFIARAPPRGSRRAAGRRA